MKCRLTKLANHQFRLEVFLSRDEQSRFGNDPALSNCHASNVSIDAMEYSYATEDNDTLQKLILFALRIDQNNNELRHEYIDLENSIYSSPKTPLVFLFRSLTATHQFPDLEIHYKQQPENLKKIDALEKLKVVIQDKAYMATLLSCYLINQEFENKFSDHRDKLIQIDQKIYQLQSRCTNYSMKPEDASELEHIEQALQQLENDMTDLLCEGVLQHLAAVSVTDTSFMTVNEQILQELRFKNNLIKLLTEDFQVFLQKKNIKPQDPINPEIIEYAKTLTSEFDQKFEKIKSLRNFQGSPDAQKNFSILQKQLLRIFKELKTLYLQMSRYYVSQFYDSPFFMSLQLQAAQKKCAIKLAEAKKEALNFIQEKLKQAPYKISIANEVADYQQTLTRCEEKLNALNENANNPDNNHLTAHFISYQKIIQEIDTSTQLLIAKTTDKLSSIESSFAAAYAANDEARKMLLLATRKIDQADANLGALKTSPDLLTNKNCITDIDVAHEDNLKQINQLAQIAKTAPLSRAQQQILQKSADDCATLIAKTIETTEEYKEKAKLIAKQASKKRGINIYAHIRLRPNKANQAAQPEEQATPSKKFPLFNWWKERSLILRAVRYVRSASKEKKKGTVSVKSPTLRV